MDAGEVAVVREVVDEALQFFFGVAVFSFEGEEDVSAFPVPVEIVEIGVEGVVGGVLGGVSMVFFFWKADGEAKAFVSASGDFREREGVAAGCGIEEGKLGR